jgi:hypothetical protein
MSFYYPPWESSLEPNQGNVRQWLDNLYSKFQPIEQARWIESQRDSLCYAGCHNYLNSNYNFSNYQNSDQYFFNLVQQPVNMVTGYERQHRKSFMYQATEGADNKTTDQYTKLITHICSAGDVHEKKSKAKELSAISGMVLLQPYLDYTGDDLLQGECKIKIWEFNSFLTDPYFRMPDMSDANWIWCQEYISNQEVKERFPDYKNRIQPMAGTPQTYGSFYFLPENYNMSRNDLSVLSYVWYKWKRKKNRLYSRKHNLFFDYAGGQEKEDQLLANIPDLEKVTVNTPCWKVAVILNDQLMFQGYNPLGFTSCPMIPYFWNYDPHLNYYNLRVRSLVRPMRSAQFLFNHKVIQNNDIAEATINAGWKRKIGAVANEDNLKKSGQGYDIIINDGYELTDCEKIIPSAVPESDLALAQQMSDLIFQTSGVNLENWSGQQDKQISSLTALIKQAANLMVFQKYFDQWDYSDKLLGDKLLQIFLHNWNSEKIALYIGEEPTPFFDSGIFVKYKTIVEEADLTPTQQNLQAQQMMEINQQFGREVFPPSKIIPKLNITGKAEIIQFLEQQEQQMQKMQEEQQHIQHMSEDAKIKELYARATAHIANAREDHSRAESNLGLYEERLSMIERNRSMSLKEKQEALSKLLENIQMYGEMNTLNRQAELDQENSEQKIDEEREKQDVEKRTGANKFLAEIMGKGMPMMAAPLDQSGQEDRQNDVQPEEEQQQQMMY